MAPWLFSPMAGPISAIRPASTAAASFINIAASPPATLYTSIGYSLDVSSTQRATSYNGGVVFTATVAP